MSDSFRDVSSVDEIQRLYGHIPGVQEAVNAYRAEKFVARCAGVPPDVVTTYSCNAFKETIEQLTAQLVRDRKQRAGACDSGSKVSNVGRTDGSVSGSTRCEEMEGTSVMPAIGWWPDTTTPALVWDLSSSTPPRYSKRDFSAREYQSSPFHPSLQQIRLVLDEEAGWSFVIKAQPSKSNKSGPKLISLASLFSDIAEWMHSFQVPWSFWAQANATKRRKALRGLERRTGSKIPENVLNNVSRGSVDNFVKSDPHRGPGWTAFRGSDLLGDDILFWGLAVSRDPFEWVLKTTHL